MRLVFNLVALALAACTSTKPVTRTVVVEHEKKVECDLVCERAELAVKPSPQPDYSVRALANANAVLESMQPAMLACYTKRIAVNPNAHAFITVDFVIGPDGRVVMVQTTGRALLGDKTMSCITEQILHARFEPVHGGGTLHIRVPFSLRPVADDDDG